MRQDAISGRSQSIPDRRICLGFPGPDAEIGDDGWSLFISTTCRHLDEANRCSVFGQPEDPLPCDYYDAWTCTYRLRLCPVPELASAG
jgi:hypothetical protein